MTEDKNNIIFNISGGNNQILPNATKAEQHFYGDQFAKEALRKGAPTEAPLTDDERRLHMYVESEESLRNYVASLKACKTAADVRTHRKRKRATFGKITTNGGAKS